MKSLWRKKGRPENHREGAKPRSRLARWLAAPLLVAGLALGACSLPSTAQNNRNTAAHEIGPSNPECVTRGSQKTTDRHTQYVERTFCKGELEEEVSHFEPPLEKTNERTAVKILDADRLMIYFDKDVVAFSDETQNAVASPGELLDVIGYELRLGVPVDQLDHMLEVMGISGMTVNIAFPDTLYYPGELFGPDDISTDHYGWYAYNVLPGEWVYLKLYGLSYVEQDYPLAKIGVITKPDVIFQGHRVNCSDGDFVFQAQRDGDQLKGWTLTRSE